MKTFLLSALLVFAAATAQTQSKILPYPIYQKTLSNGLNIVTVPFDSPGLAAFFVVVRVGSRNEVEKGVTGFAHFFEHMMFRGTEKYSSEQYNNILKSVGANANANTSLDRTIYHMTGDAAKLETMFELESDRFMHLKYSEADFKTEAGAVKGEYTKNFASPYQQLYENMVNTAFTTHTYKHTTMGFFKDIVDMPNQYQYSLEFFNRYYRPEYSTVVIVGDVKPEQTNALAEKYFGNWKRGTYVSHVPVEPVQDSTRYVHLQNNSIPPSLSLNYKGPAFSDSALDIPSLDILTTILFSNISPLYKKLVLQEQKVRSLYGGATDSRDPDLISIEASLIKKDDLQYVKDEIVKAIEQVKRNGVDEKSLAETKMRLRNSFAMSIDNPSTIANALAHYIYLTGDPESLNRSYALLDKVTIDDIKSAAKKYFVPSSLTIATISADAEGGVK
ncbi:MAG: insulinase family protein [Bacteroidetes bacterium]|nr:insulinase family protein [Bacteroidota bacterium]